MKMNLIGRTANAALAASIMASALPTPYTHGAAVAHETITGVSEELYIPGNLSEPLTNYVTGALQTANASLFTQAHFSEPLTTYATGWRDTAQLDALCEFIAPTLPGVSERYEHIVYLNAEAFLSDVNADDDLRAINGDFKAVDYTQSKTSRTVPNRGLRIVLDWDRIKNQPNWQEFYTGMLVQRLKRNAARRKYALAIAAGTDVPLVWDAAGSAFPDLDVATQMENAGDISGVTPNSELWGIGAQLLRMACAGGSNKPQGYAALAMSIDEAAAKRGTRGLLDKSRYQAGTGKSRIAGSKVVLFTSAPSSTLDPSNFKTAKGPTQSGGLYAVYVRQLSVKQWEIVVECYETEFCATTLGVRVLSVTAS
jgi:hypothetical protein